jgi:SAM-dependent methyltransferase
MSDSRATLSRLAARWHVVPTSSRDRESTAHWLQLPDDEFLARWERARADTTAGRRGFELRGWFYAVYGPWAAGKKILEVGSGIGIDGVALAEAGAKMAFVDICSSNLDVVRRIWRLKGLGRPTCLHLTRFDDLDSLDSDFDAVVAFGSLHHIDAVEGKPEFEALARRLKPGGRFIMHAYPVQRWIDEGRLPFEEWGEKTDGAGTPWAEWYDTRKLLSQLRPALFAPVLYCEYRAGAMNCIDVIRVDGDATRRPGEVGTTAERIPHAALLHEITTHAAWSPSELAPGDGNIRLVTAPAPWAYAAAIPLHIAALAPSARCRIEVRAMVEAGRIGIGVTTPDGSVFIDEAYLADEPGEQTCWLEFSAHEAVGSTLIFRNAASRPTTSRALIRSVDLFTL